MAATATVSAAAAPAPTSVLQRLGHQYPLQATVIEEKENDLDTSVDVLFQSFLAWHRLQTDGIVKTQRRDDAQKSAEQWHSKYPERFEMLHNGSKCQDSQVLGKGKYSRVYQRGRMAYKVVRIGHERDGDHLAKLRCNMKELCFFHSMDHPNLMKCTQSQVVMEHGAIRKIIHEMKRARCTLEDVIYAHEIACYQDLVYVFRGIALALQYMHKYHIVHGDVKPSNVLIDEKYNSILSDFTLTTFQNKGREIAFGTLFWRSPECLMMQACETSSDVWSLGMMLIDCLYGCFYMADVMDARTNEDMLCKLVHVIGPPPPAWTARFLSEEKTALLGLPSAEAVEEAVRKRQIHITISDAELGTVQDLIGKLLSWNAQDRPNMDQILQHPFFGAKVVVPMPKSDDRTPVPLSIVRDGGPRHWNIYWRDKSEREFIQRWAKYYYHETFQRNMAADEDWLLFDIVITPKRLIDRLKTLGTTYNVRTVIRICCKFHYFVWKNYWPADEPLFEAQVFHVLTLLGFNVFALQPTETDMSASAAAAAPSTPPSPPPTKEKEDPIAAVLKPEPDVGVLLFDFSSGRKIAL